MNTSASNPTDSSHPPPGAKVARNAFHLVLGQASTTVLAVLLSAALGRWLGAADFDRLKRSARQAGEQLSAAAEYDKLLSVAEVLLTAPPAPSAQVSLV